MGSFSMEIDVNVSGMRRLDTQNDLQMYSCFTNF